MEGSWNRAADWLRPALALLIMIVIMFAPHWPDNNDDDDNYNTKILILIPVG